MRPKAVRDQLRAHLQAAGLPTRTIEANHKDSGEAGEIRLATMHRAKGLEFDQVVVVARKSALEGEEADHYRKLAYVALSRGKKLAALLQF